MYLSTAIHMQLLTHLATTPLDIPPWAETVHAIAPTTCIKAILTIYCA
jgi:hypothetical protein